MDRTQSVGGLAGPAGLGRAEPKLDARLERDLILLLSKLEQGRSYLAESTTRRQPALALQATLAMLNEAVEFAESRLAADPNANADTVLARAGELASSVHALFKEV